jgi:hypothetical protein
MTYATPRDPIAGGAHEAALDVEPWPDGVAVPTFGARMVCTRCGIVGADARPNWQLRE